MSSLPPVSGCIFTELGWDFSNNKSHLIDEIKKKGNKVERLLVIFGLKIHLSSLRAAAAASQFHDDKPATLLATQDLSAAASHERRRYNLCLRASPLVYSHCHFFPPHLTVAYTLNFYFGTDMVKHLVFSTS